MVENLKELNAICQKPNYKTVGNWMVRHILRDLALPITWLLLHTPVTANQVTLAALVIGGAACLVTLGPGASFFLSGMLLLQFWYLLDHVDGQIARYRKSADLTGRFFDFLMHHVMGCLFFLSLGIGFYLKNENPFFIFAGAVTAVAIVFFNHLHDIQCKAYFEKIIQESGSLTPAARDIRDAEAGRDNQSAVRRVVSILHKTIEFHVVMNLFTLAAFVDAVVFRATTAGPVLLFLFYFFAIPALTVLKCVHWIRTKRIDREFAKYFRADANNH